MNGRLLLWILVPSLLAAGCGSGGGSGAKLNSADVAVVGSKHIDKNLFSEVMHEAEVNIKAQGQTFPKAGTTQYSSIRSTAVNLLVQQAEKEVEAAKLGITVKPAEVAKQLKKVKQQCCKGSETRYKAELKKAKLTDQEVRDNIQSGLINQKLFTNVTSDVKVTPLQIQAYYIQHQSEYKTPASRDVRYILVGKKKSALAQSLYQQLNGGGDSTWCTLAKKYSKDPSSSGNCGKATFSQGQTVAEFDKLTFSLPTNKVAKVNTGQYGWFVLQPVGPTKAAKTTSVKDATANIKKTLLETKRNEKMSTWVAATQKAYCKGDKVKYQAGYVPSPDPCAASKTTT
jgi:parvulin-like peptidyl-prolyl isomerase